MRLSRLRKLILALALIVAPLVWLGMACKGGNQTSARQNFVLILADDMGYSDLGCYGGEIATPNLDRLAENGLRFTQFYNAARCCPSRAALLTGLYPHQVGMGRMVSSVNSHPQSGPYQGYLNDRGVTIAEILKTAGYAAYMSGKWHVGEKPEHWTRRRGFDRYFGLISGASSYFELIQEQERARQMVHDDTPWQPPAEGFYMTDAISDSAAQFLRQHHEQRKDQPFLLYVAYTAPHWPLHALPEDLAKYQGKYNAGWEAAREQRYRKMQTLGIIDARYALSPAPATIPPWNEVEDKTNWARRMEVYAAMIDRMDQGIGRILDALKEIGAGENTLVLFLSDNGACAENVADRGLNNPEAPIGARGSYVTYEEPWANVSNTPFRRYKQWVHEGGIATPLIARWPRGIKQRGRISDAIGHVMDIMATYLDLAGVAYPDSFKGRPITPLEGKSLAPIFSGKPRAGDEILFWEHLDNRAVREGKWKLVYAHEVGEWELYDMEADPSETQNLAAPYPERVAELRQKWEAWAERVGVFANR